MIIYSFGLPGASFISTISLLIFYCLKESVSPELTVSSGISRYDRVSFSDISAESLLHFPSGAIF
jgi:hypothetical protein